MIGYYKIDSSQQVIDENGFLHSGDIGHLDEDGYLTYVTRIKELIIRGGENISPGEVAAAISEYEVISDVKVLGIPHNFYDELVGACVVLKPNFKFDMNKIIEFLYTKISKFKVPIHYEIYESFPLLQNGKIDSQTLKKDFFKKS